MIVLRKIDLSDYIVETEGKQIPYRVKDSIEVALFHPDLKLNSYGLMKANKVSQKIKSAQDIILLEEADYDILKNAIEGITGFTKQDIEFVRRVLEAPEVSVKEE